MLTVKGMHRKRFWTWFSIVSLGSLLLPRGAVHAAYQYENIAFYSQTNPSSYAMEGIAFNAYPTQTGESLPVYRFVSGKTGDHFYTISESEKIAVESNADLGYVSEGVAFYAYPETVIGSIPVFRFVNKTTGDHFYTASTEERDAIRNNPLWGYIDEGTAFSVSDTASIGTSTVYRFYNPTTGDHFYTASETERDSLTATPVYRFVNPTSGDHFYTASKGEKTIVENTSVSGYSPEGIAFYAQSSHVDGTVPVYRFVSNRTGDHFYTASEEEKTAVLNTPEWGYMPEGIAFYAYTSQMAGSSPIYRFSNPTTGDHFYTASESEKNILTLSELGPEISVGLWNYTKSDIQSSPFKIFANKAYSIRDKNGNVIATVDGGAQTRVTYDSNSNLRIFNSIASTLSKSVVSFDAADGYNADLVFDVSRPGSSYDRYRGKVKVQYTDSNNIWAINTLPMEHYVWGEGETTGSGDVEHTKVMTTIFRTYGYWYAKYATKYATYGFKIRSDSGSQVYYGYDWETAHPNIRSAAQSTRGVIATYGGDVALTPYSSWSDGRTRSFEERWGSTDYPWCQSVSDPYGKHPTMTTTQLENAGNHMVGLIANGSVSLATDHDRTYSQIMRYYYTGIGLDTAY
jgi:hypothetical protein